MEEVYSPEHNTEHWHYYTKVPNYIAPSIFAINYDHLFKHGIHHLVFDVDNTLVPFGEPALNPQTQAFLRELASRPQVRGLLLATNSIRDLGRIRAGLGTAIVQPTPFSFKPLPTFYRRIVKLVHDRPAAIAMIGDKLIQDIWGANHVGLTTVLVQPLGRDNWFDRALRTRWHERRLLRKYLPHHRETWF